MAKFQSPLLGYNNNVRHKNRVFHIQTEDSGVNHPHIITHLFMDGGRILKSVKRSYAEHVGADGMSEIVRGLMKEQHKAMFIALRDGQFDALVEPGAAPAAAPAPSPSPIGAAGKAPAATAAGKDPPPPPTNPDPARPDDIAPVTIDETKRRAPASAGGGASSRSDQGASPAASVTAAPASAKGNINTHITLPESEKIPTTTRQIDPPVPSAKELTLDFDALERAAQESGGPSLFQTNDLPPPPKNMFGTKERGTGKYRTFDGDAREEPAHASRSNPPAAPRGQAPARSPARSPSNRPGEARYAPARPAAIFGSAQRREPVAPAGDELLSDKSLDEVILSYLAEDLEPPRRK